MEQAFDRLRQVDPCKHNDAMGPKAVQQLCTELNITFDSLEMMIVLWKFGATHQGSISRTEWMQTIYTYSINAMLQLRMTAAEWVKATERTSPAFMDMYVFIYDYIRGEDRFMSVVHATNAWKLLLPSSPLSKQWQEWFSTTFKQPVTRDLWTQVFAFLNEGLDSYDADSSKLPVAIDEFVEWTKAKPSS